MVIFTEETVNRWMHVEELMYMKSNNTIDILNPFVMCVYVTLPYRRNEIQDPDTMNLLEDVLLNVEYFSSKDILVNTKSGDKTLTDMIDYINLHGRGICDKVGEVVVIKPEGNTIDYTVTYTDLKLSDSIKNIADMNKQREELLKELSKHEEAIPLLDELTKKDFGLRMNVYVPKMVNEDRLNYIRTD